MRKQGTLVLALLLALALVCAGAVAETTDGSWYEMNEDSTVLTIRLPVNEKNEGQWAVVEPAPEALELIAAEITDHTWVASFRNIGKKFDDITLRFAYTIPSAPEEALKTQALYLHLSGEDGKIDAYDGYAIEGSDAWFDIDQFTQELTVRLPANATTGYEWTFELPESGALKLVLQEYVPDEHSEDMVGAGGIWTAKFEGTFKQAGAVTLRLKYARSWEEKPAEMRTLDLWLVENSSIFVTAASVETSQP